MLPRRPAVSVCLPDPEPLKICVSSCQHPKHTRNDSYRNRTSHLYLDAPSFRVSHWIVSKCPHVLVAVFLAPG